MAITARRHGSIALNLALVVAHNKKIASLVGANFHADALVQPKVVDGAWADPMSTVIPITIAASAVDLPSSIVALNAVFSAIANHFPDNAVGAVGVLSYSNGAHKGPIGGDATSLATVAAAMQKTGQLPNGQVYVPTGNAATDQAFAITAANAMKTALNAHFTAAGVHYNNDGTNTIVAANASTLPTLITLVNALATSLTAHVASAPAAPQIRVVAA